MIYRNSSQYALRALTHMARSADGSRHNVVDLAAAQNIPRAYLSQIFKQLVEGKILKSIRGPGGGYVLARPADKITFYDVKLCVDGPEDFEKCVVGLELCNDQAPCPAHESWKKLKVQTRRAMCETTLAKASEAVRKKQQKNSRKDVPV